MPENAPLFQLNVVPAGPPVAVKVYEFPIQTVSLGPASTINWALTVTVETAVDVHPFPSVPVTVYVEVTKGDADTF